MRVDSSKQTRRPGERPLRMRSSAELAVEFERALKAADVEYERHLYPGTQHGFNNDTTPRYDAAAAKVAWERTIAFLNQHVR